MEISNKYLPLFEIIHNKHPEVDTVIMTGGRLSGKSYGCGIAVSEGLIQRDWKVLYTRFTNQSIKDSIYAEFVGQLESTGYDRYCDIKQDRIHSKVGEGEVVFKGIKTGSGNQTANLKSLSGFNCFVVDEAEEIPSKETFKKVFYSIRSSEKRNISILILNPTGKEHWIYKEYYQKKEVPDGFCGIKGNVLYIHTSYLDVNPDFVPDNIRRDYEELKEEAPDEYNSIVLGGWLETSVGKVYSKSELKRFKMRDFNEELVEHTLSHIDPADDGTDNLCQVITKTIGKKVYVTDVIFTPENSEYSKPLVIDLTRAERVQHLWVEKNGVGAVYGRDIAPFLYETTVIPYSQLENKHSKIIKHSGFIKKWYYFRSDYEAGSDYDLFMNNLFLYNKDNKKNKTTADNDFTDDGPCSLSSLNHFTLEYIGDNWR